MTRGAEQSKRIRAKAPKPRTSKAADRPGSTPEEAPKGSRSAAVGRRSAARAVSAERPEVDPLRAYLRKMATTTLLSWDGEIEIAKRIVLGKKQLLHGVFRMPVVVRSVLELADRIKRGQATVDDLCAFDDTGEETRGAHDVRVLKTLERLRRLERKNLKLRVAANNRSGDRATRDARRAAVARNTQAMLEAMLELNILPAQIEGFVKQLNSLVNRAERAKVQIDECAERSGMNLSTMRRTLRELRDAPEKEKRLLVKLGLRPGELAQLERQARQARLSLKEVAVTAGQSVGELRRTPPPPGSESRTANVWPIAPRQNWSKRTCVSWSASRRSTRTVGCSFSI